MVFADMRQPFWVTMPCYLPLTEYWICEKPKLKKFTVVYSPPKFWCPTESIQVDRTRCARFHKLNVGTDSDWSQLPSNLLEGDEGVLKFQWLVRYTKENFLTVKNGMDKNFDRVAPKCLYHEITPSKESQCGVVTQQEDACPLGKTIYFFERDTVLQLDTCRPGHTMCVDRSCVLDKFACDMVGCDARPCYCTVNVPIVEKRIGSFCQDVCHPSTCSCGPLLYQCASGGCIHFIHVVDGNNDCRDGSDEIGLYSPSATVSQIFKIESREKVTQHFKCRAGHMIPDTFVDDLIPDCPGSEAEDESLYISLMRRAQTPPSPCLEKGLIPCIQGHPLCIHISKLCVYDVDIHGEISYCRDASHLRGCSQEICTNTFKCPSSYCIPYRRVCDGIAHCPEAEDELSCENYVCPGMMRCHSVSICVHPSEICDGVRHCPYGDDEEMCHTKSCPLGCHCLAGAVWCLPGLYQYIPLIETTDIVALVAPARKLQEFNTRNISTQTNLKVLDLSDNVISKLCHFLNSSTELYRSIIMFYLSGNQIDVLTDRCFMSFIHLTILDLHDNPLREMTGSPFWGLQNMRFLNLRGTQLIHILSGNLKGLDYLAMLDIVQCKLIHIGYDLSSWDGTHLYVQTDDLLLCCVFPDMSLCSRAKQIPCQRLLGHRWITFQILSFTLFALFLNIIALFTQVCVSNINTTNRLLNIAVLLFHKIRSICVLYVVGRDMNYNESFTTAKTQWQQSLSTLLLGTVMLWSTLISILLQNINMFIFYRVVTSISFSLREFRATLGNLISSAALILLFGSIAIQIITRWLMNGNSEFGLAFAVLSPVFNYDKIFPIAFVVIDTISFCQIFILPLIMTRHIRKFQAEFDTMLAVAETEHDTAIKKMHNRRVLGIQRRNWIAIIVKLLSWFPSSLVLLCPASNIRVPKVLFTSIVYCVLPLSMYIDPIIMIKQCRFLSVIWLKSQCVNSS